MTALLSGIAVPAWPAFPAVEFTAQRVEVGALLAEGVKLRLEDGHRVDARAQHLRLEGIPQAFDGVAFEGRLPNGIPPWAAMRVDGRVRALGQEATLALSGETGGLQAKLEMDDLSVTELMGIDGIPHPAAWLTRGRADLRLHFRAPADAAPSALIRVEVDDLAFDSPDGRFAAESLGMVIEGEWDSRQPAEAVLRGAAHNGELLIDSFYRDFSEGSLEFSLRQRFEEQLLALEAIRLTDREFLTVEASARLPSDGDLDRAQITVERLELDFPGAYRRYLEPVASVWTLDGLSVTGRLSWEGSWDAGVFRSGDLELSDLSVVDTAQERFAFTGLEAILRPGDHGFDSRLAWRGLLFGRINLGAGEMSLHSEPGSVTLRRPLELDVLGGRLDLHELRLVFPGRSEELAGEPDIRLRASLDGLDMQRLTAAMDWPSFGGRISGDIPGVRLHRGVLEVDGGIAVNVFDGRIDLRDLRIERPFGVLPSLAANVDISDLDLEQLTQTFSFGRIAGRLDGQVQDLRMLDWRPVAFDAWLGTPERQQDKNDISRQAVNRLTTIGGGGATAALTSPLLRLFDGFSYRRLGLGCRLSNDVCEIRGIAEDEVSVLLLEGAGIPKITIRAYNRRVDWPQMVANLLALSAEPDGRAGN